jgi:asparagine synthase (glutamine-hydrolysing)
MSALGGIFNFNNEPLRKEQQEYLLKLWNSLEERGPDGGDAIVQGPIGMCYKAFHTNRESRTERQPFIGANKEALVGDLRLDNRDELICKLRGLLHKEAGETTDIELAMAAYQRWGEVFPLHLVGEFALMLYDPNNSKVLLARDHIGVRPLYYQFDRNRLICASELEPLLEIAGIPLEVNDDFVAGYLMYDPEPELTPCKNIYSVKPFHVTTFSRDGRMNEARYWDLSRIRPIRYKHELEYEDEFNFHFGNAVRSPLRTDRPAFADLSGGLDSSSIVCVAHQAIQQQEVQAPGLTTVSLVSSGSPTSDQRKYIRYVEEHIGQSGYYIDDNDYPLLSSFPPKVATSTLNPLLFSIPKHERINECMREVASRVLLCGSGGDEITCGYTNSAPELADQLVHLRLFRLHERTKAWSRQNKMPYLNLLWQAAVLLLPPSLYVKYRARRIPSFPAFLNERFVKEHSLRERLVPSAPFLCDRHTAQDQAVGFWTASRSIAGGYRRHVTRANISYPFLAKPLVEYMQAIPHDVVSQPGQGRRLMRRALENVLPSKIVKRKGKGNPEEVLARAFIREWPQLLPFITNTRMCSRGYIDDNRFRSAVEKYMQGQGANVAVLLKLLALEVWLRGLEKKTVVRSDRPVSNLRQSELPLRDLAALAS